MKTKKQSLLAVAVLMAAVMGGSQPAVADDTTTVTITGRVRANTCTVGDKVEKDLGEVSVRDFEKTTGKVVGSVEIPVEFKDCGGETKGVSVTVSGTAVGSDGAFKNSLDGQEGGATNVGVYFYEPDGTLIKAGNNVDAKAQSFTTDTTLNYKASYVALTDSVGAGSLSTVITLNFTYL